MPAPDIDVELVLMRCSVQIAEIAQVLRVDKDTVREVILDLTERTLDKRWDGFEGGRMK